MTSSAITSFLSSPLGGDFTKILTGVAVLLIIGGIAWAVIKHHRQGVGAVMRRIIEVIVLGVILAVPSIWGPIVGIVITGIKDAGTYIASL